MKITAVDTAILRIPTRKPIALDFPYHSLVVAHVRTDEGVTGLGYTLAFGGGGVESIQAYLVTRLAPLLIGQDPLFVERLWERMYRADRGIKRQGVAAYALSALDIALWDIAGKAAGLPLYKLWGAVTDRVAAYGSGGWPNYTLEDLIGEAQAYVARGCRYYKMKIHHPDPRANRARVEAVKAEVLGSSLVAELAEEAATAVRQSLVRDLARPKSEAVTWLADRLEQWRQSLVEDAALRVDVDHWVKARALELLDHHHGRIAALIEQGVRALGPEGAVRLIEEHAGDDLQYIRVNGTVVGGLAGGALYAIHLLLRWF